MAKSTYVRINTSSLKKRNCPQGPDYFVPCKATVVRSLIEAEGISEGYIGGPVDTLRENCNINRQLVFFVSWQGLTA